MQKYLVIAICLLLACPAFAQTVEQDGANDPYSLKTQLAERVFLKYHRAIEAEESCKDRDFSKQDMLAMNEAIMERMEANSPDVAVGAARLLTLADVAEDQMNDMIDDQGCNGAGVQKALQFFDERLANVAPEKAEPAKTETAQPAADQ